MVKIKDLTEKQLLAQIEKYEKIYHQLLAERSKRIKDGATASELMTERERKLQQSNKHPSSVKPKAEKIEKVETQSGNGPSEAYHLKIDDKALSEMKTFEEDVDDDEEEEVRVTQLLQLSKAQLEELRGRGDDEPPQKEKKGLFGRKKKN